jgi:hypothetical protein
MVITGIKCNQVGYGRKYVTKAGVEKQDMVARCVNVGKGDSLGSAVFFDYKLNEAELKDAKKLEGKMLELEIENIRQPFAGAPVNFEGKILKAA